MKNESEPKFEEDTNLEPEEIEETPQVKKPNKKKSTNVFEYINQNAKRHKQ